MRISALVALVFQAYYLIMLARVVLSWLRLPRHGFVAEQVAPRIYALTEPVLRPVRRALSRYQGRGGLDFSPMIVILALIVVEAVIYRVLITVGL